jgi:EAL domain-containing protein (putative c-di-GMP-specific phosphodiesterase class I)
MASENATAAATQIAPQKAPAAPTMAQLLSFVFASADVVLEIEDRHLVSFATGAAVRLLSRSADSTLGKPWRELFEPADAELVEAALRDTRPGERRGPYTVSLATQRGPQPAMLTLFRMPGRDSHVAASLSLCAPGIGPARLDEAGLTGREEFETAAASLMKQAGRDGASLHVDLLEFAGLTGALSSMSPAEAMNVRRKLAAMLRAASYGGLPAAAIGPDRFALLRSGQANNAEALAERVRDLAGPKIQLWTGALALDGASPTESLRAIRYAIDRCIEEGPPLAAKSFEAALRQTVTESTRFKDLLREGRFELVYQPVVNLETRELHHYEALTRFEGGGGPAATIKLAEELGLVVEFDLAIVRTVAQALCEAREDVRIAANISAFSLQSEGFIDEVLKVTAITEKIRPRLMLELTESHKISDLSAANDLIQRLRQAGHVICLDDFGAGAASMDYLRQIEADIVKFDGRFIQALGGRPRDTLILKRLAELCRELEVSTVAEMIETEEAAKAVADLGVQLGQGWLFGKPTPKPESMQRAPSPVAARRRGEVESWG